MIAFIRGNLYKKTSSGVVIDTGGIGYFIYTPSGVLQSIGVVGDNVFLHTYMKTSDDGITLYGFLTEAELSMFNSLIGIGGIGPKAALSLLSQMSPEAITVAVMSGDTQSLSKAPGIGKKTAGRVVLELKDKFKSDGAVQKDTMLGGQSPDSFRDSANEAVDALEALGYRRSDSLNAVMSVYSEGLDSAAIIKLALKKLASSI